MSDVKYWFGFRQTSPKPPGQAIACGPYSTQEEARIEREKAKAWDCEVSIPYMASTQKEAKEKAKEFMS
ncbi:MAG: hypothetical protein ABII79_01410 [bacterium]